MPRATRSAPSPPRAYQLARSRRPLLLGHYRAAAQRLAAVGQQDVRVEFEALVSRGAAAINMSMPSMLQFLASGRWLNVYEAVASETGLRGRALDLEVARRLRDLGPPRLAIDRLFRFRRDTHYASLNLGGIGPHARYGVCCAIFSLAHWLPFHTCFAGDTILACFDAGGRSVLTRDGALARFAIGEDLRRLAVLRFEAFLDRQRHELDGLAVRARLEGPETMIELHLHGRVTRQQITEVRLPRERHEQLSSLSDQLACDPGSRARELDPARAFHQLKKALARHRIPLVIVEDH
jgi:hypothetical protein